jgi:deferrochelatase/peroxidase EfeB
MSLSESNARATIVVLFFISSPAQVPPSVLHRLKHILPSFCLKSYPFGTADMHVALAIYSSDDKSLEAVLEQARQSHMDLSQVSVVYSMKFSELSEGRNPFGFKDGLHNPHVEGSSIHIPSGSGPTVKAGEFIMGYADELGQTATGPEPEVLRRNGTFLVLRKFYTRVAAFRKYLREQASSPEEAFAF